MQKDEKMRGGWPGPTIKQRRVVMVHPRNADLVPQANMWGYSYRDLAELYGLSLATVRQRAARGDFDPTDLLSICMHWYERMRSRTETTYDVVHNGHRRRFKLSFDPEAGPGYASPDAVDIDKKKPR